jgi:DNA-binding transcriptional MerR regulator
VPTLMQVGGAARELGVHENTLRRWEQRGLITTVRLPSGSRRCRPEDIAELRDQMSTGFAPMRQDDDIVDVRATSVH